jgi:hypothetical protein
VWIRHQVREEKKLPDYHLRLLGFSADCPIELSWAATTLTKSLIIIQNQLSANSVWIRHQIREGKNTTFSLLNILHEILSANVSLTFILSSYNADVLFKKKYQRRRQNQRFLKNPKILVPTLIFKLYFYIITWQRNCLRFILSSGRHCRIIAATSKYI